ncbi:MAG: nitrilase-related carbon-nitrogen hydrolase, partial [Bacteroidota bacterium]
ILKLKGECIGLAICADIDNPAHPAKAQENGISLYVPSIFFSKKGISAGHQMLSQYAKRHQFCVLMSNYCGAHWQAQSGGSSAFWDAEGNLISALGPQHPGLLIVKKQAQTWKQIDLSDLHHT